MGYVEPRIQHYQRQQRPSAETAAATAQKIFSPNVDLKCGADVSVARADNSWDYGWQIQSVQNDSVEVTKYVQSTGEILKRHVSGSCVKLVPPQESPSATNLKTWVPSSRLASPSMSVDPGSRDRPKPNLQRNLNVFARCLQSYYEKLRPSNDVIVAREQCMSALQNGVYFGRRQDFPDLS